MTVRKHLKQLVRERMTKTGESYTSARRHIVRLAPQNPTDPALRWHYPGNIPAATALRVLLAQAGIHNPKTRQPFSEAMVFGIAGGIGIGVCAFHYAKENFSSFFIGGRHLWFEDVAYLTEAAERFGQKPVIKETGGANTAVKQLRDLLEAGPCIAWVDMVHLPHRALPAVWSGGGYHVVTVYKIDGDHALIGDLTDEPVTISLKDLATSRARIKKQKHRLLAIPQAPAKKLGLRELVWAGLKAGHEGMTTRGIKGFPNMFNLESIRIWADRLHSSKEKQSWDAMFPRGIHLWHGLTGMHRCIEHYGTGGGLCRPLFAEFLDEAGKALGDPRLRSLSTAYAKIGRGWSELAGEALPDNVPLLQRARRCHDRYAELFTSGGSVDDKRAVWAELDELAAQAKSDFPLSEAACADLRRHLQESVRALLAAEQDALSQLGALAAGR